MKIKCVKCHGESEGRMLMRPAIVNGVQPRGAVKSIDNPGGYEIEIKCPKCRAWSISSEVLLKEFDRAAHGKS